MWMSLKHGKRLALRNSLIELSVYRTDRCEIWNDWNFLKSWIKERDGLLLMKNRRSTQLHCFTFLEMWRQTDRQTHRQADSQTGRLADSQTGWQTDWQTGRHTDTDRQTGRQADRHSYRENEYLVQKNIAQRYHKLSSNMVFSVSLRCLCSWQVTSENGQRIKPSYR